jgi:hypothetical protein
MAKNLLDNWVWNFLDVDEATVKQVQDTYQTDTNLQWIVKKALKGHYETVVKLDHEYVIDNMPLLDAWLSENKITVSFMCFFVSDSFDEPDFIHKDIDETGLSINFPVANCEGTTTFFYHKPDDMTNTTVDFGNGHAYIKCLTENKWVEHSRYELVKPTIMNNQVPHKFINPKETVRICLSMRCDSHHGQVPVHLIKEN